MANTITAGNATNTGLALASDATGIVSIVTGSGSGTTAVTVDASQNVGIGTSSPQAYAGFTTLDLAGSTGGLVQVKNTGATIKGTFYVDGNGARVGTQTNQSLLFDINGSERARIDSSGNLLVGVTAASGAERLNVTKDNNGQEVVRIANTSSVGPWGIDVNYSAASPNGTSNLFLGCRDTGGARFNVRSNGGLANYSANNVNLSDRREKKDFAPAGEYLSKICAIPVQTFRYIDQTDEDLNLGVVAQDVQAVAPELVAESDWGTPGEPKTRLSIYQTDLQYALMKCIQEQQAMIEELKAKVAALEAK